MFKIRFIVTTLPLPLPLEICIRLNYEMYELYKEPDLVKYIKIDRLAWAGHLVCMDNNKLYMTQVGLRVMCLP